MARGIFLGRHRQPPDTDTISPPVLQYTDAQPRSDLKDVQNSKTQWDFHRPRASERPQSKRKKPAHGFDFQIHVPPSDALSPRTGSPKGLNESMIGIALGSPRLVESQNIMTPWRQKTTALSPNKPKTDDTQPPPPPQPLKRKPSTWKKIGGLLKGKSGLASSKQQQQQQQPFYQVRISATWPNQGSSHSLDYQQQPDETTASTVESNPITHTEVWPCLQSESVSKMSGQAGQSGNVTQEHRVQGSSKDAGSKPLLKVDIPSVEMERYSVMFKGLLGKEETQAQAPSLGKRSRTLDDVSATKIEERSTSQEQLLPPRRASSPWRSKSPSFNLFPSTPPISKASRILGTPNIPREPSPFRSRTPSVDQRQSFFSKSMASSDMSQEHLLAMPHGQSTNSLLSDDPKDDTTQSPVLAASTGSKCTFLRTPKPSISDLNLSEEPERQVKEQTQTQTQTQTPPSTARETKQQLANSLTLNTQLLPPSPISAAYRPSTDAGEEDSDSDSDADSSPSSILSPLTAFAERTNTERFLTHETAKARPNARSPSTSPPTPSTPSPVSSPEITTTTTNPFASPRTSRKSTLLAPGPFTAETPIPNTDSDPDILTPISPPTVEVSIARSVSVSSRGKKQVIVPIGPSRRAKDSSGRLGGTEEQGLENRRRARTVTVTDGLQGHRYGRSQDVRVESI